MVERLCARVIAYVVIMICKPYSCSRGGGVLDTGERCNIPGTRYQVQVTVEVEVEVEAEVEAHCHSGRKYEDRVTNAEGLLCSCNSCTPPLPYTTTPSSLRPEAL